MSRDTKKPESEIKMYRKGSVVLLLLTCCALAEKLTDIEVLTSKPTRCSYGHAFDMYGAYCAGLRLSKIPNLRGGIEILDFSDNKLQEINAETLAGYTSLKFLYLAENQIYSITESALTSLTSLQVLDLSKNVIIDLPSSVFQLPSLQKLYLSGNPLITMSLDNLASNKQIKAPLELLDLSDCRIKVLPDWGVMPQLLFYNISFNPLTSLEAKHFSVMCNLAKVDLTKSLNDITLCSLKPAIRWFQEKHVYFQLDDYSNLNSKEFDRCPDSKDLEIHNGTYYSCKSEYLRVESQRSTRRTWLTITGGLGGFLVGFMLLLYLMHRHNVAQTKSAEKKAKAPPGGDSSTTAVLLNDVS